MDKKELERILSAHKAWLNGETEGIRADLRNSNLRYADLRNSDLRDADLRYADLRNSSLRYADLRDSSLQYADLRGANLDFSCWPLWCGSLDVKVDARIAAQLAYHFCRLDCDDPGYIAARNEILGFANTFHRVKECGELEPVSLESDAGKKNDAH